MSGSHGTIADATTAVDLVVHAIRDQIALGELRGGEVVGEEELANRLGVSRTPVREAIGRLVAEGMLVKDGSRSSAQVFQPSMQELLEIYEIRLPLEILAARIAAEQASEEFIRSIEARFAEFRYERLSREWMLKHEQFHLGIFAGSERPRLLSVLRGLRAQSEPYVRFAIQVDPKFRERSQSHHAAMVAALAERDGKQMERLVRRHLAATTQRVSQLLEAGWLPVALDTDRESASRYRSHA